MNKLYASINIKIQKESHLPFQFEKRNKTRASIFNLLVLEETKWIPVLP